ncbi:MAG: hypothetical protein NXH73_00080 [Flavobacteriaceae bacterium]|nr:hypothetical protein [Flavobacteriaceae bacterium]
MKNLVSIFLSTLLLLSSAGVTYGQHYCGGQVVADALMIGEKHLSCSGYATPSGEKNAMESPACCENVYHQVVTDDNYASSSFDLNLNQTFVAAFVSVFVMQEPIIYTSKTITFTEYLPPPLLRDIPVLYQTFLI